MVAGKANSITSEFVEKPTFDSTKDEVSYWKNIAEEYIQKLKEAKEEFDEYQDGSRELEAELETQLQQFEQRVRDLVNDKTKLEDENELLREKLETRERQTYLQIIELQDENVQVKAVRDEMARYIRELEQTNDDLERTKRATISSLEEFDSRLSNAIERNVLLENELEEKEQLIITVQRLKDESRDLKEELAVNKNSSSLTESKVRLEGTQAKSLTENIKISSKLIDDINNIEKCDVGSFNDNLFSKLKKSTKGDAPPSRISALKIVADILQKVSAMETKLARYRNIVEESSLNEKQG